MTPRTILLTAGFVCATLSLAGPVRADEPPRPAKLTVMPAEFDLHGPRARQPLLVTGSFGDQGEADFTRSATYESLKPDVASVSPSGLVTPKADGTVEIVIRHANLEARARVTVRAMTEPAPIDFRTDVIAALSRSGCNQGACHGSPQGKNGFRLSLRGYDPDLDLHTLTRELGTRRVNVQAPEESLLLLKGSGRVRHGGSVSYSRSDPAYRTVRDWITEGCRPSAASARLTRLEVLPEARKLHTSSPRQQVIVRAHFEGGAVRDVTELAVFTSSNPSAVPVDNDGIVQFRKTAEAAILVRYLDQIVSTRLTYVRRDPDFKFTAPPTANYVDEHVFAKQRELQLMPAPLATDAVFLRRVYLDMIGTLPTEAEAREFLDSKDPERRAKLIDRLLERDEFASFWALKWADVLRGSPATITDRGVHSFHRYLVRAVADDRPMDVFARDLLTGTGNTLHKPAANFYRISRTPEEAAETAAQLFLGVRLQCAKCHNHPFEAITQTDYYGLAAYFARVQRKGSAFGLDDEVIYLANGGEVNHPQTRKPQPPSAFGASAGTLGADDDRRQRFADWLTRADNRYFAPSLVNRIWFHMIGRGIVDPVDDFRDTNPPSNPQLLKALTDDFIRSGFRVKPLVRIIANSRTYQLASNGAPAPSPHAADPDRYFTTSQVRMLSAEQIIDAVSLSTGVPETFKGYPRGTRAIELAEGGVNHPFLQAFAKPVRDVSCECAREEEPSLPQMLHLLNNAGIQKKLKSPDARLAAWLKTDKEIETIVERMYLATLSRRPTPAEVAIAIKHVAALDGDRAAALQDVHYALINLSEFLLRH
ncbi:MAG: DUF1553 domain-containing protein [Gemmataceae bacterium]|nr:DUF1553 domain-containing protein [Gemmataceae bacterium]